LKKTLGLFALLSILIFSLLGCTEKTNEQIAVEAVGSKGVFYEVTNEDTTVYLFGSVHIGLPTMYPLHEKIESAFESADHLAVEIDINDLNPAEMMQIVTEIGLYNDGSTIEDHISADLYDELLRSISELGLQENGVTMFKPWLVSDMLESIILEKAGFALELGVDQYFLDKAVEENKEIISLETIKQQLDLYTILSPESQEKALRATLLEQEENQAKIAELIEMWIAGDIAGLSELRIIEDDSQDMRDYFTALTDERDLKMTAKIEDFLTNGKSETYFVVVGSLHLVGENSIVDLLESRGYDVKIGIE
jgi:uncharacterized protein